MARVSIFLIIAALIGGTMGCAPAPTSRYDLTISSSEGGLVTAPGEDTFTYDEGRVIELVADAEDGHRFVEWTGDVSTIADVNGASTTITMNSDYDIKANFVAQYVLTIESTDGGDVIIPGEGTLTYDADTVVPLVAEAEEGYRFVNWTGDVEAVVYATSAFATITVHDHFSITAEFEELDPDKLFAGGSGTEEEPYRISDWHNLNNVRYFLSAHYRLMNDLDSSTVGHAEAASETANHGKGWQPIGTIFVDPVIFEIMAPVDPFAGSFDGQRHEIRDLFINRPGESLVGLYADVDEGGLIQDVGLVNTELAGGDYVGGLVGVNYGTMNNSYSHGSIAGDWFVGGLVGENHGTVNNCDSTCSMAGNSSVGGLVGENGGTVRASHSTGSVTGWDVGGLVGWNSGGTVSNSYYNYHEVLINGENVITIGALFREDFEQWLANDRFLDVNERLSQEDGCYVINNVSDFKQLLAFGQDDSLKFRLKDDLDLGNEVNFYIPYLAAEFDGNGRKIANLRLNFDSVGQAGLFGFLAHGGEVSEVRVENVNVTGSWDVGSLVGCNRGTVSNSYSTGSVTGDAWVGGLVGLNNGTVSNSYFSGNVTGWGVGGLAGSNSGGTVSNSYYNYHEVLINGENVITIGALFREDFEQWLANDRFLDVNERLSQEDGCYVINNVSDFKQLLAFGQDDSLKFRLKDDLDLGNEVNFYIPYLAAEFDGNGRKIANLRLNFDSVGQAGLFGFLAHGGKVSQLGVENVDITGPLHVGGLVGHNAGGTVSDSYVAGSLTGDWDIGGLVGGSSGIVNSSYFTGSVTGGSRAGGLVGWNQGTVSNSYSTGSVTGDKWVGGVGGWNTGTVSNSYSTGIVTAYEVVGGLVALSPGVVSTSFWDTQTSGQATSGGGTGKTTTEMESIATFSGAAWDIIAVANPGIRNTAYIWNIVDDQTYPFLSWQSVS
jgi:hypothetical protein